MTSDEVSSAEAGSMLREPLHSEAFRLLVSLLLGMLLSLGGVWIFDRVGGQELRAPAIVHDPLAGERERRELAETVQRFRLDTGEAGRPVSVNFSLEAPVSARRYRGVHLELENAAPGYQFGVAWVSSLDPDRVHTVPLGPENTLSYRARLDEHPDWRGQIQGLALMMLGPPNTYVNVQQLMLEPVSVPFVQGLRLMLGNWAEFEGWGGYSVNYIQGGARPGALLSPVVFAAFWVTSSILVYVLWSIAARRRVRLAPLLIIVLLGWVALDLRWQVDLLQQLERTHDRYAGKTWEEKRRAAEDGSLYEFVEALKTHLGIDPVRVFVVNDRDYTYSSLRAKYHLLPHNADNQLPLLEELADDDYLLVFRGVDRVRAARASIPSMPTDSTPATVFVEPEMLSGSGSEAIHEPTAPSGTALRQQGHGGSLIAGGPREALAPGYYRVRFHLAAPMDSAWARLVVALPDAAGGEPVRYVRRVALPQGGFRALDLGIAVPDATQPIVRVTGADPGVLGGGVEFAPLVGLNEPRVVIADGRRSGTRRLVETVMDGPVATVYRVR
ncbi:hypothetical protein [Thioalkalivibrio paradoxus]|uniref:Uncharacterized protein n=1 Tax=Thioalkalivibrio paradoxus ARh 1 TaxID=713585 RepID=W0DS86_9GAMM|nr:hypothetical protein [Thioalkalivibrio paradoxus]AHF00133.1 hypothetical protein THITH_10115 [Thioalkalivibrio paradoxus ARh 1]